MFSALHQTNLYTDTGILSSTGFFSELFQRLTYRILPPAVDENSLRDCLALFNVLDSAGEGDEDAACKQKTLLQLLEAIQTLSYRISAMGLEPELIRNQPDLETFESPFLMQNFEVIR